MEETHCTSRLCLYLALCDFARRFSEERGPGREKVLFGVILQAAVATAHRAIPRHLRRKLLDSNSATSKKKNNKLKTEMLLGRNELHTRYVPTPPFVCDRWNRC